MKCISLRYHYYVSMVLSLGNAHTRTLGCLRNVHRISDFTDHPVPIPPASPGTGPDAQSSIQPSFDTFTYEAFTTLLKEHVAVPHHLHSEEFLLITNLNHRIIKYHELDGICKDH